ncbi:MAG: bifunctional allantoicase/(S)-ureidoglycine aminohydrolase [Pseudomonadota bacterium]
MTDGPRLPSIFAPPVARAPAPSAEAPSPSPSYALPERGLPDQAALHTGRAVFTEAYAVIPRGVMTDIVTSRFPGWEGARAWILARPMTGFAETFAQYVMEVAPGGGCGVGEPDGQAQGALFVTAGAVRIHVDGRDHTLGPGHFAYLPPWTHWSLTNPGDEPAVFHWIRKRWTNAEGLSPPDFYALDEAAVAPVAMPGTDRWATTRFMDPDDMRHDMAVTIVTFEPGGVIPFEETHVMEHGLYVLEGKAVYRLNRDWVEVEAGDFMWLRAFCPQACYAAGPGRFRYLLYKDVNRHPALDLSGGR